MPRLKVLTWHIHGSYLYYLSHAPVELYVLSKPGRPPGYLGRHGHFPWGANVHDMPVSDLPRQSFDAVLFQSRDHYEKDQYEILTPAQQRLPKIYLEHDPPRESPFAQPHWVDDPATLLVHVTHFNALMWNSRRTPVCVIPHGVTVPPDVRHTGELARGIVVINHLARRGRRLGEDVYARVRRDVPLDLVGMGAEESPGGIGEIRHDGLCAFASRYRFFFNPIRYTSLGLAVCEAMMLGMPVVGLATTEMSTTVENGVSGYVHNDLDWLTERMAGLLADPAEAHRLGEGARRAARERFAIERFARDWRAAFEAVAGRPVARARS
ncbi:transferase [Sulfurifustis variabilis]|uniref:Transferase n=1 Tax=Sulfurifustis variabilis TaxID=1675686 RepID=A0A1B4V453_9GAMM|nr:glycosyltransferase [Sulfurifustis variabilis]BAU48289.1 transferase [Sulfurifustis variabilis]